jgi:hypothetical protein
MALLNRNTGRHSPDRWRLRPWAAAGWRGRLAPPRSGKALSSNYILQIKKHVPPAELQKTWALYLKWSGLCKANAQQ